MGDPTDVVATAADICFVPDIKRIMMKGSDEEFTKFKATLLDRLPELSRECLEQRDRLLVDLVVKARKPSTAALADVVTESTSAETSADAPNLDKTDAPATPSPPSSKLPNPKELLRLATSWFKCSAQCGLIDYDRTNAHGCLFYQRGQQNAATNAYINQMGVQPWNLGRDGLSYSVAAAELATKLIQACGKDPSVTTMEEMDELNPRVAHLHKDNVVVTTWRKTARLDFSRR